MIASERYRDGVLVCVTVWCEGCGHSHTFPVHLDYYKGSTLYPEGKHRPMWAYNGVAAKPTFTPSLRQYYTHPETKAERTTCHIIITDGMVQFCSDCPHQYAGQARPLVDIPEGYGLPYEAK